MYIFLIAVFVITVVVFCIWLLYGARYEKQTCYVPTGEIKFVVAGESCKKVIPNLTNTGYHYDYKQGIIIAGEPKILSRPFSILGVYLVSLWYPLEELHVWHFEWDKLSKGTSSKDETGFTIVSKSEYVNSLYFLSTYPIVVEAVDLKGNLKINIVVNVTFRVVNPTLPVFVYKGKWLAQVSASVKGAVADFARGKTYDEFRAIEKEGDDNPFATAIETINKSSRGTAGIIETFGVAIHRVDFVDFDLVGASPEEEAAVTAVELARLKADAAIQKAREIETLGEAEAKALTARLKAADAYPGGMNVLLQEVQAGAVSSFKGDVLSLGGDRLPLAITRKEKQNATKS